MQVGEKGAVRYEPDAWFIVFQRLTDSAFINRWIPGKFKHVLAIGYVAALGVWVTVEVTLGRTRVIVRPDDDETRRIIGEERARGRTLMVVPRDNPGRLLRGGWCVPAMAHLVGSGSCALLCDRFWRDLVSEGAQEISDGEDICSVFP